MNEHKGTLPHGLKVGDALHREFVLREATTADLFDAEMEASPDRRLAFRGALLGCQLVKLGELSGPISLALIRKLPTEDFDTLVSAQAELEKRGKQPPGG